jgi:hypothetical protein
MANDYLCIFCTSSIRKSRIQAAARISVAASLLENGGPHLAKAKLEWMQDCQAPRLKRIARYWNDVLTMSSKDQRPIEGVAVE